MTPEERASAIRFVSCYKEPSAEGVDARTFGDIKKDIAAAIRAAVLEERERCAKVVEAHHNDPVNGHDSWEWCSCEDHIAAIRKAT